MGIYLNPGNSGFERIIKDDYEDKTGLISLINKTIGTTTAGSKNKQIENAGAWDSDAEHKEK